MSQVANSGTMDRTAVFEQCRKYVQQIPGAVSGQGGHNQTYWVAAACLHGFQLSPAQTMEILKEFNARCSPPWKERELQHKIDSFDASKCQKPAGWLLKSGFNHDHQSEYYNGNPKVKYTLKKADAKPVSVMPEPIPNGMVRLLKAAFTEGEFIRMVPTEKRKDSFKALDTSQDMNLDREAWIDRWGKPSSAWNDMTGVHVGINPMNEDGRKDSDVTAFRHCLVESDEMPKADQYRILSESGLPITAIIDSGGKSIHAWVRVDAKDIRQYHERREAVWNHLTEMGFKPDEANKNPSRLSRAPGFARVVDEETKSRQELLQLNIGPEDFATWEKQHARNGAQSISVDDLREFNPRADPNSLLGHRNRWLCRGGSCLWVASTGVGKSTIATQAAMLWALGRDFFGVTAKHPLKSLIIQAENDLGDIAEMFQGIEKAMELDEQDIDQLRHNFRIEVVDDKFGLDFKIHLDHLIDEHRPDMVWIDPLLSFAGADISKQEEASKFLRQYLTPIIKKTGIILHLIHHTGKPPKDNGRGKSPDDLLYAGLGSSELMNWVRAGITITPEADFYSLTFTKRGKRAGATTAEGSPTTVLSLDHSPTGHAWIQLSSKQCVTRRLSCQPEEKQKEQKKLTPEIISDLFEKQQTRELDGQIIMAKDTLLGAVQKLFGYPNDSSPIKLVRAAANQHFIHQIDRPKLQYRQGRAWVSLTPFPDDFEDRMIAEWERENEPTNHDKKGDKE